MSTAADLLIALAGAMAVVMGVAGLAHIERAWLRWTAMIVYVVVLTVAVFDGPVLFEVIM